MTFGSSPKTNFKKYRQLRSVEIQAAGTSTVSQYYVSSPMFQGREKKLNA